MVAILFIASQSPFDYKNPRLDFVAFTEKSEKPFVRLQVKVYTRDTRSISPVLMVLLIIKQFHVMFACRNEKAFHCR